MISRHWRRAALVPALILLSGCGLTPSLLPLADEPSTAELSEWQYSRLLEQPLKAMPEEVVKSLSERHAAEAARFLTRTLETAPDGSARRWHSADKTAALAVRPISTAIEGGSVCRRAMLKVETADIGKEWTLHACRTDDGLWARRL